MKNNLFINIALIVILIDYSYGTLCNDKSILSNDTIMGSEDITKAFSKSSSCVSLETSGEMNKCCYIKAKFKNETTGQTYKQKGCLEVPFDEYTHIKDKIKGIKNNINSLDKIKKAKVNIDCSSKYINLFGLFLFAFLL
jgi:hypothetical protein